MFSMVGLWGYVIMPLEKYIVYLYIYLHFSNAALFFLLFGENCTDDSNKLALQISKTRKMSRIQTWHFPRFRRWKFVERKLTIGRLLNYLNLVKVKELRISRRWIFSSWPQQPTKNEKFPMQLLKNWRNLIFVLNSSGEFRWNFAERKRQL